MGFFKSKELISAIEFGTSKICVLIAEVDDEGRLVVLGHGEAATEGSIRKGEPKDPKAVMEQLETAVELAERQSGVLVEDSYVVAGITGAHIKSETMNGAVRIIHEKKMITEEAVSQAVKNLQNMFSEPGRVIINTLDMYNLIDGRRKMKDPTSQVGSKLDVYRHVVHAGEAQNDTVLSLIDELIEIDYEKSRTVFNGLASAYSLLTDDDHKGCLLMDIGAGTTDYILFQDDGVYASGCIPIGTDHIANDLSIGFDISFNKAQEILLAKDLDYHKHEGHAFFELKGSIKGSVRKLPIASIEKIIDMRVEELFTLLYGKLEKRDLIKMLSMGIVLTGGGSQVPRVVQGLNAVFKTPIRVGRPTDIIGNEKLESPRYSTVCGLLKCGYIILEINNSYVDDSLGQRCKSFFYEGFERAKDSVLDLLDAVRF